MLQRRADAPEAPLIFSPALGGAVGCPGGSAGRMLRNLRELLQSSWSAQLVRARREADTAQLAIVNERHMR